MDERRVAVLVAGVGLIVLGVVVTGFPRGVVLGLVSIIAGIALAGPSAVRSVAAGRERPTHTPTSAPDARNDPSREAAIPGVSLWNWANRTGWGTTPWGITARVAVIAVLTGAIALLHDSASVSIPAWAEVLARIAVAVGFFALFLVPSWIIERLTKPRYILRRSVDLAVVVPAGAVCVISGIALTIGVSAGWILAIAVALFAGGISVGVFLSRATSR